MRGCHSTETMNKRPMSVLWAVVAVALISQSQGQAVPTFLWSSSDLVSNAGLQANYEVTDLSQSLLSTLLGVDGVESSQSLVTVITQGPVTHATLSQNVPSSQTLKGSVDRAAAAIYLPNVQQQTELLSEADVLQIGDCQSGVPSMTVNELRGQLTGEKLMVRICEDEESKHHPAVEELLLEAKLPYVMAYLGQSDEHAERPMARTLLQTPTTQVLCDDKCQTQVRLFETIILLVILLMGLWIGMNMLHIVDTPTKFETEKKEQNRHQD